MQSDILLAPDLPSYRHVDMADPLEIARWSWLLDVSDRQICHAVSMVGNDGQAVSHYVEYFWRSTETVQ